MMMCRALVRAAASRSHVATLPGGDDVAMPGLVLHRVPRLPLASSGSRSASRPPSCSTTGCWPANCSRLLLRGRYDIVHAIEEAGFYAVPLARLFGLPAMIDLDSDLVLQLREHGSCLARALAARPGGCAGSRCDRAAAALTVTGHLSRDRTGREPADHGCSRSPTCRSRTRCGAPDPARMADLPRGARPRRPASRGLHRQLRPAPGASRSCSRRMPEVLRRPSRRRAGRGRRRAGRGRAACRQQADELGVGAEVRLIGRRPPDTMPEYMGMAEVLVSPRQEPYITPLKIFSYMASGRPIVATDLPTHTVVLDRECRDPGAAEPGGAGRRHRARAAAIPSGRAARPARGAAGRGEVHLRALPTAGWSQAYDADPMTALPARDERRRDPARPRSARRESATT